MSNQKPQSIRDVYFQYVSFLHLDWFTFEQLFGEREAVALLNRRTGKFFGRLQVVYRERIVLEIAKLFDKAIVAGNGTASLISGIAELKLATSDPKLIEIHQDFEALKLHCKGIIEHRHRSGAHLDHKIAMEMESLPPIPITTLRKAIEGIDTLVNKMSMAVGEGEIAFKIVSLDTGVDGLLSTLKS